MEKIARYRYPSFFMLYLMVLIQFYPFANKAISGTNNSSQNLSQLNLTSPTQISQVSPFTSGDGIFIDTFPDTASFLNKTFPIDDLGMAEFPMIGKVKVTDKTAAQIEELLKESFKAYLRYPNVRVKPVIRISVLGGVAKPGLYFVDQDQSLWTVLQEVGGPVSEDGLDDMRIERNSDVILNDIHPHYENGTSLREIGLRSGDQIWVPSPTRATFWDDVSKVLPLFTFATSLYIMYLSYQGTLITARAFR